MSGRLPATKPKEAIRALEHAGFVLDRIAGSHYILKHPLKPGLRVTVPFHNKDLKQGTLLSLIKQSGLTQSEFAALL